MDERQEFLAERFEANRSHLRAVAYRMLGSQNEAEDAVQEAWFRLSRTDTSDVQNLRGWLTTVVSRVCLDILRSRKTRREGSFEESVYDSMVTSGAAVDPEQEALLADSVGVALLVVLDTLNPAERIAFVLHDMFDVSFEEIASIIGRSPDAARQLASRARRRVRGVDRIHDADLQGQRKVVDAFLAALRAGDFERLLAVLDPEVVVRSAEAAGGRIEFHAEHAIAFSRMAQDLQPALIDGSVGLVLATDGRVSRAGIFKIAHGKIVEIEVVSDRARLDQLELAVPND